MTDNSMPGSTPTPLPTPLPGGSVSWLQARLATARAPVTGSFLARRIFGALIAAWGAATIVFVMIFSTGNPAVFLAPETASVEDVAAYSRAYGFDRSIPEQYLSFIWNTAQGNFPRSLFTDRPAFQEVLRRVPNTLLIGISAVVLGAVVGLAAGYVAAMGRHRWLRGVPMKVLMVFQSTPSFFLALVLILVFSLTLRWLPTGGTGSWQHAILPTVTLAAYVAPGVARLFRAAIREVEFEDHILTARAMGLPERRVRLKHIAVNALGSVIALLGLQVGGILSGAVIVESVFAWPGVGELLVRSVNNRDFPVVLAAVMLICLGYVIASLLVDVAVAIVDPRARDDR
ncbi:ABC-transporter permease protein [Marinibacterium anthonyi]|nr:ABC-transporter permease protein [Marinibacterium anthonyi]